MATSVRLSKDEQERIRKQCIKINKILVGLERAPIKDSEFVHHLINLGIERVEVARDGGLTML